MKFGELTAQNQYSSFLTSAQIADGINLAKRSSRRLLEDAKILLKNGRYPSAAALAILSIEENGKELVLRQLAVCLRTEKTAPFWKKYRNHTEKNKAWILPLIASEHDTLQGLFRAVFDSNSDHPEVLDWVKQASVYSDCVGRGEWQDPEQLIDELHATRLIEIADHMQGTRGDITEEELREAQEMVASGVTEEKLKAYTDKWAHKDLLPIT